ncbi:hypothetical protein RIF29_15793 [Crotalaria pallida]|uniref:Uncharacterized protein n=1 Tax=Crotalaria pallida TaxID=3830 RepID=A0AAN9FHS2_CROPI
MAKKRGRPPKTPSKQKTSHDNLTVDLSQLDEEDIVDIDSLTPKQAATLLKNIDAIRERLKGKTPATDEIGAVQETQKQDAPAVGSSNPIIKRPPSVWDSFDISKLRNAGEKLSFIQPQKNVNVKKIWVEKKKPSREEIEKIDDTLKLKQALESGTIPEENAASALEIVRELDQALSGTELAAVPNQEVQNSAQQKADKPAQQGEEDQEGWTPVIPRGL